MRLKVEFSRSQVEGIFNDGNSPQRVFYIPYKAAEITEIKK
jgi:hypothetical protein